MFFHNAGSTDLADFHFRVEGAARRGPLTRCRFRLLASVSGAKRDALAADVRTERLAVASQGARFHGEGRVRRPL
jgi:hypothetical protein